MSIKVLELETLVRKSLLTKYSEDETDLILPVVMFGELSGRSSHGIMRVISGEMCILARNPIDSPKIKATSNISKIIEGNGNPGMLVGNVSCNEAIKVAKKMGIGMVGSRGSIGSSGSLSYYCEKIAKENLIGIIMARAPADVTPLGGLERLFGTNPIAFGIPTSKKPLIFDMATSAISYGAVMRAKASRQKLPDGVAIDEKGNLTKDPDASLKGAFLPFDQSYKGAGLSMMVEILAGVLTGANFSDLNIGDEWGNLFMVFKPELFISKKEFGVRVNRLIERVRNSKTKDRSKVRISGENTFKTLKDNLKKGSVEVDVKLVEGIRKYLETGEIL